MAELAVVPQLRTDAEIADLKRQWKADPCWDIEDTEGFEAHRHELEAYHLRNLLEAQQRIREDAEALGLTKAGYALLFDLQLRVERLEKEKAHG